MKYPPQETRSRKCRAHEYTDLPKNPPETTYKLEKKGGRPETFEAKGGNSAPAAPPRRGRKMFQDREETIMITQVN